MYKRTLEIIRKEFIQISRDSGLKRMVVITPILQLLLFGYVVATEIRSLRMFVLDRSHSEESRRLVERFVASGYFVIVGHTDNLDQVTNAINRDQALLGLVIPTDYAENVRRGVTAKIQLLVDGSNSNTATIALGYAGGVIAAENNDLMKANFRQRGFRLIEAGIKQEERIWFNPSLRAINYTVPGIVCLLLMEMMVPLTAFSIVKERERGTIEQLMVTPIHAGEMLLGKTLPYVLIGLFDATLIVTVGTFWFGVPIVGSVLAMYAYMTLFLSVSLGLGILIATIVATQQQAALTAQFALVPNILLSGFMFPIESMPAPVQAITHILPMRYILVIMRGVIMKGLSLAQLWDQALALAVLGTIVFSISWYRFRKVFG